MERWPAFSRDGARLAYVRVGAEGNQLRVRAARDTTATSDSLVTAAAGGERPSWAPDGDRLAWTAGGARGRVVVVPRAGTWTTVASERGAHAAWSADGRTLALVPIVDAASSYNGDPDRLRDRAREIGERPDLATALTFIAAPMPPDAVATTIAAPTCTDRAARNAAAFDRAWARGARLYYAAPGPRRTAWERLRDTYRPRALAAVSDSALAEVLHRLHRDRPTLRDAATGRAAVSSAHPLATQAGLNVLAKGGNVVDAAVAVSFMLGVVEPDASGIGGYGQMVVKRASDPRPRLVDFMSRAAEDASLANAALLVNGRYPDDGPVLANVPGTVAGMHLAWRRWGSGRVAWADLVAPAIAVARNGFAIGDGLATTLALESARFAKYPASRALFFRDGRPLVAGDTLRNPDLAWTLEQIAQRGAAGFYEGEVARRIVADLRGGGNVIRPLDLARYHAVEREPVRSTYRGHELWSSAPPVSGGAILAAQLGLRALGPAPAPYRDDAGVLHALLNAWLLTPATRGRIADPGLWPIDLTPFTHADTLAARWRCARADAALRPGDLAGDTLPCARPATDSAAARDSAAAPNASRPNGTTAFTVADADGNVVAVTQTLGTWGGTFHASPGLGFLWNDKLTSYPLDPTAYGARLPNARHGSTLAPTIVLRDGRPVLAIGAAGNAWITSAVLSGVIGVIDEGLDAQRALELPRFLPSGRTGTTPAARFAVDIEDGIAPAVLSRLRALGWELRTISAPGELRMGYGAAITFGRRTVTAGADPRREGAAGAIP